MIQLSNRLEKIASMVTPGSRLADVGTDHGFVPIALCQRGVIPSALAMDINQGPLLRADEHIRSAKLEDKIETRLSNGMNELKPGEADTVLIAGMGGMLIVDILTRGRKLLADIPELVLSPHSDPQAVREVLGALGFIIAEEACLREEGKFYTILRAVHAEDADKTPVLSQAELYYGPCLLAERNPLLLEQLRREKNLALELIEKLSKADTEGARRRIGQVEEDIRRIEAAMTWYDTN